MKTIKLIAADLDGTLLTSDKSIGARTIDVLKRCTEKGVGLCFVTARGEKSTERAAILCDPDAVVTDGGALVRVHGKIIEEITLPQQTANEILNYAKTLSSFYRITLETPDGRYLVSKAIEHGAKGDYSHAEWYDFSKPLTFDVLKMVIYIENAAEREAFSERFRDFSVFRYVNTDASFIAGARVRKWNGLLAAAKAMNIQAKEIVAFGDDIHDIEMIEKSAVGVAVGNALPEVKAAADYVAATNDEDGVARWLEENLLG